MAERVDEHRSQSRTVVFVKVYPLGLLLLAVLANAFGFGVDPLIVALPSVGVTATLVLAAVLLLINHSWLMTSTALVRVHNHLHSTPEEWAASGIKKEDAPEEGWSELERHHNAQCKCQPPHFHVLSSTFSTCLQCRESGGRSECP